jgi:hypothetical protein
MTKEQAFFKFWNGFGVQAYPDKAVPDGAILPYITYTWQDAEFGGVTAHTVQYWSKTESEAEPNAKAREIKERISMGGIQLKYDKGTLWLTCGSPFCINSAYEDDNTVKLRQLNINVEHH